METKINPVIQDLIGGYQCLDDLYINWGFIIWPPIPPYLMRYTEKMGTFADASPYGGQTSEGSCGDTTWFVWEILFLSMEFVCRKTII